MPIFQDDLGDSQNIATRAPSPAKPAVTRLSKSPEGGNVMERRFSEESIRTDLCEGLVPDSLEDERQFPTASLTSNFKSSASSISNRVELIERLKRGESPTWLPNRNVQNPPSLNPSFELSSPDCSVVGVTSPGLQSESA